MAAWTASASIRSSTSIRSAPSCCPAPRCCCARHGNLSRSLNFGKWMHQVNLHRRPGCWSAPKSPYRSHDGVSRQIRRVSNAQALDDLPALAWLLGAILVVHSDDVLSLNIERTCHGIAQHASHPGEWGSPDYRPISAWQAHCRSEQFARKRATFASAKKQNAWRNDGQGTELHGVAHLSGGHRNLGFRAPPKIEQ